MLNQACNGWSLEARRDAQGEHVWCLFHLHRPRFAAVLAEHVLGRNPPLRRIPAANLIWIDRKPGQPETSLLGGEAMSVLREIRQAYEAEADVGRELSFAIGRSFDASFERSRLS